MAHFPGPTIDQTKDESDTHLANLIPDDPQKLGARVLGGCITGTSVPAHWLLSTCGNVTAAVPLPRPRQSTKGLRLPVTMPHRVVNFFRSSTSSLENPASNLAKITAAPSSRRRESPRGGSRGSGSSERLAYTSSIDETDVDDAHPPRHAPRPKMSESRSSSFSPDSHKDHSHHHRLSFPIHFGRSSKEPPVSPLCAVDWKLESPPIVLFGDAEHSTGALVSGQLFLLIKEDQVLIDSFDATLSIHVTQKKPFANHCHDCAHDVTELKKWTLLPNPLVLTKGTFPIPVSPTGQTNHDF